MSEYVLAIDTALNGCGVAVFDPGSRTAVKDIAAMTRGHAERLMPMIGDVLAKAGIVYADLALIAVTVGPGAFTGLRIGLATAQALGLALGRPVAGITTTAVLAAQFQKARPLAPQETLAVILETKRADFYAGFFGAAAADPVAATYDDLSAAHRGPVRAIGDGLSRFAAAGMPPEWEGIGGFDHPDPAVLAELAYADFIAGRAAPAQPLYLRPPDVTTAKKPLRRLAAERPGDA